LLQVDIRQRIKVTTGTLVWNKNTGWSCTYKIMKLFLYYCKT